VLNDLRSREVREIYCLGDLVGYGPRPNEVIDLIREGQVQTIAGNYDDGIGYERGSCGCYYSDDDARRIGDASYAFTERAVSVENKAWLRSLPRERCIDARGTRLHLVHGSPRRINEYLLKERDARTFERLAAGETADVLVFGHTHVPWHRRYGGVLFVNAGSAGRPKDGDPRAAYTLLGVRGPKDISVEVVRVAYDVEETAAGVVQAGLPPALAESFRRGA
jgi:predicted phosphodiesterase